MSWETGVNSQRAAAVQHFNIIAGVHQQQRLPKDLMNHISFISVTYGGETKMDLKQRYSVTVFGLTPLKIIYLNPESNLLFGQ